MEVANLFATDDALANEICKAASTVRLKVKQ
jgi:hypothetical protein